MYKVVGFFEFRGQPFPHTDVSDGSSLHEVGADAAQLLLSILEGALLFEKHH